MHIVSKRKDLTLHKAMSTPNGMAVLGFFIEVSGVGKSLGVKQYKKLYLLLIAASVYHQHNTSN